jgi:hypothetical protein
MTTIWQPETKRQVGISSILMNDTVALFDSTTLFGGSNPVTVWTPEAKTS